MPADRHRRALTIGWTISVVVLVLELVAAAGGLLLDGLYRDNAMVTAAFRGNDLVTLIVACPLLGVALVRLRRRSARATLLWIAMLAYSLYNYLFYLYGAAFNEFFLVYTSLVTLSSYALGVALAGIDASAVRTSFDDRAPARRVAAFMLAFAIPWTAMEVSRAVSFVITGQIPVDVQMTGHPTAVVYATDLALLMPLFITGAIWLWQKRAWGYVLGVVFTIKGFTYALALLAMSAFARGATGAWDPFVGAYAILATGCGVSAVALIARVRPNVRTR